MKLTVQMFFLSFLLAAVVPSHSYAQWSTDPYNNLIVGYGLNPELASDSAGGCYITYEQNLSYPRRLILERLNRYGYKPWGSGKQITGLLPEQRYAKIVEDGTNGVIVSYLDIEVSGDPHLPTVVSRLRVQRIDSSGNFLWDANGVRVSLAETNQGDQAIVSDGNGGCIVAWVDTLGDLRINRLSNVGIRVWGDSGRYVWNSPERPPLISDGGGGCYIVYGIGRLQRFDRDGNMYWPSSGILVPTGATQIQTDSQNNVYLFGGRFIGYNGSVNVWTANLQKVNTEGVLLWDTLGVFIDTIYDGGGLSRNRIVTTRNGMSFLGWDNVIDANRKVYGQIVSNSGITLNDSPFSMSSVSADEWTPTIVLGDSTTAIYLWRDYNQSPSRLYVQRFDLFGNKIWDTMNVITSIPTLTYEQMVTDCNSGSIIVGSGENFSIRVQQVSKNGNLGEIITNASESKRFIIPNAIKLYQNYPNPFNPTTTIQYDLPRKTWVRLDIFNVMGQHIQILREQIQNPGTYQVIFDASRYPSGIYFYRLMTNETIQVRKFTILK